MKTIELDYPIKINGAEVNTLNMRRPKVRDALAADKQGKTAAEVEYKLFANLVEISPKEMKELDMVDYAKLQEAYADFLSPAPKNSDEPSP